MKVGPKAAVEPSSLPFRPRSAGSTRFAVFCQQFIRVLKGTGALSPLRLRPWRIELVGSVLDADPQPRTAVWMLPRGQGKSSLMAAWGSYELFCGGEGATVCVVAVDEGRPASCSTSPAAWWSSTRSWRRAARCSRTVGDPGARRAVSLPAGGTEAAGEPGLHAGDPRRGRRGEP